MVGEEVEVVAGPRDHRVRHRTEQRAVVPRLDLGDLRRPLLDQLSDAVEDLGTLFERHRAPGLEALPGGVDGPVDLDGAATGDLGDRLLVDRRDVVEGRVRGDALPADPMLGRDLDSLDLYPAAQRRPSDLTSRNGMDDPRTVSNGARGNGLSRS
jgi:hypothetical protein